MSVTVKQKNPQAIQKILDRYKSNSVLAVGFPKSEVGGQAYPDGTPVIDVAIHNNFGTERIPRRDFMGPGGQLALKEVAPIARARVAKINTGEKSVEQVLEEMGIKAADQFKKAIKDLKEPPNAPATIKRKGTSNPLVAENNLLMRSVTHVVRSR